MENEEKTVKRKSKDSVFTHLFRERSNVFELYKALHLEDNVTTEDDIRLQTLNTILVNDIYNDLGFIVNRGGKATLVMLVEAQSTWNPNMTLRMLFYLSETYRRYLEDTQQNENFRKRLNLPKPELYVIYSGERNVPDEISLKDDFFEGDAPVDIKVRILNDADETIYGQYIGFCRVYDNERKIYKNSIKCIEETIRICMDKGYLTKFLEKHKREVVTMMSDLFDEQVQREKYDMAARKEYMEEGREEERENTFRILFSLIKQGILTVSQAAEQMKMSVEEFEKKMKMIQA